jgi:hypothetical protein
VRTGSPRKHVGHEEDSYTRSRGDTEWPIRLRAFVNRFVSFVKVFRGTTPCYNDAVKRVRIRVPEQNFMTSKTEKYDVALSFVGEDRDPARELAKRLQTRGYSVFFDEFKEADLWGASLSDTLKQVYENDSRFCVMFISQHYVRKPWTNHERRAALSRMIQKQDVYVLPIRLDDSDLPGLPGDVAYLDLRKRSIDQVFENLSQKLGPAVPRADRVLERRPGDAIVRMHPSNFVFVVIQRANLNVPAFNFDCHLVNESTKAGRVQRLEAIVTPPSRLELHFTWNLFYEYVSAGMMIKNADPQTLELSSGGSRLMGIQFVSAPLDHHLQWPVGRYQFQFRGWVNHQPRGHDIDLITQFDLEIGRPDADWLNFWARAGDAQWRDLNDPHDAVAIPLVIDKTTLRVA